MNNKFIVIEGSEGVGKSTQIKTIEKYLLSNNIDYVLTREPGGTSFGESIRSIILDKANQTHELTDSLLFYAARYENYIKIIKPALKDGKTVVCDRFHYSTLIYQGIVGKNSMVIDLHKIFDLDIEEKLYRESRINITNQDFVSPPSSMQDRIRQEYLQGLKAKQTISKGNLQNSKMMMPTKGVISSEFGVRRFINDQPRNRHVGLDIAAKEGSPVVAPLKGKVILSENFFYKGNVIYLDHGDGFITSYSHLSKREVIVGQNIPKGEILGYVGSTGRVTGPHLHWEVSLLGTLLNPEIFLNL